MHAEALMTRLSIILLVVSVFLGLVWGLTGSLAIPRLMYVEYPKELYYTHCGDCVKTPVPIIRINAWTSMTDYWWTPPGESRDKAEHIIHKPLEVKFIRAGSWI
jgi:hypothetical protein